MDLTTIAQNAIDALTLGSLYALLALGIALIFGIMRLINFAHGELIMVGAFALVLIDGPVLVVVAAALAVCVVVAIAMDRVAFAPVRGASPATLLVTSFAVSYLLQNLAILVIGSTPRSQQLSPWLSETVTVAGLDVSRLSVATIVLTASLLAALAAFLARTQIGIQMRAAAEDFRMAQLLGVRSNRVIGVAFAISGVLAGAAAFLLVAQSGTVSPVIGLSPVLFALIAAVLGGLGSLPGAVLGGYTLGALSVALQVTLPLAARPYRDAFLFGAVGVILLVRPHGLLLARTAVGKA